MKNFILQLVYVFLIVVLFIFFLKIGFDMFQSEKRIVESSAAAIAVSALPLIGISINKDKKYNEIRVLFAIYAVALVIVALKVDTAKGSWIYLENVIIGLNIVLTVLLAIFKALKYTYCDIPADEEKNKQI